MKLDKIVNEPEFKPITFSITVESEAELIKLRSFLDNVSHQCLTNNNSSFALDLQINWSL